MKWQENQIYIIKIRPRWSKPVVQYHYECSEKIRVGVLTTQIIFGRGHILHVLFSGLISDGDFLKNDFLTKRGIDKAYFVLIFELSSPDKTCKIKECGESSCNKEKQGLRCLMYASSFKKFDPLTGLVSSISFGQSSGKISWTECLSHLTLALSVKRA